MICSSCRRTLLARIQNLPRSSTNTLSQTSRISLRSVATVPATKNATPTTPPTSTTADKIPPKAISSAPGTAQPFSEPFFPSTTATTSPLPPSSPTPSPAAPRKLTSSIPGGTPLSALNYFKQPPRPLLALEDTEYPPWLWGLVPDPNAPKAVAGGVDTSSMTKKMRAKYERKMAKIAQGLERVVPVHEQSRDLVDLGSGEGAMEYAQKRKELTVSMRGARRKGIREANFLRSM